MVPRFIPAALLAAAIVMIPMQAHADDYVPDTHTDPTLAGSTVVPQCENDVPWISYHVELTDPENVATSRHATLILSSGAQSVTLDLGDIGPSGVLDGKVLWPGASVGPDGRGDGWPGWQLVDGEWVETTGNFAWTRGAISAEIKVNPELPVPLSYPPASPVCLTGPGGESHPAGGDLASTGVSPLLPAFGVGAIVLIVLGGLAVGIGRRRRRTTT